MSSLNLLQHPVGHWSPEYVLNRIGTMIYERRYPDRPWLTPTMTDILDSWLRRTDTGLEWGSGRSTQWFAKRVGRLVSLEHVEAWYEEVSRQLRENNLQKVEYQLRCGELDYVSACEQFSLESLDFCLVDGIARDKCALAAIPRLKPGGILIVDDIQRYLASESRTPDARRRHEQSANERWQSFLSLTSSWRCIWTTNGVRDTALFVKPSA